MILVEKDAWGMSTGLSFPALLLNRQLNLTTWRVRKKELPMILLATSITTHETDKAKVMGFVETVIMKPLRPSLMAACLQQALGLENKGLQGQCIRSVGREKLHKLIKGKNILVVDDNLVNRRVAAGALKKYGASVECCESGKAAIALLQPPHTFDACLMDIQMPEMDG